MRRNGSGLSPPMSNRRIVTGRLPSGSTSCFNSREQLGLGRRSIPGKIELLDPQQSYAIGAVVECKFDVILNADIRFDSNQLAIERTSGLFARSLAPHQRGLPIFQSLTEFRRVSPIAARSPGDRESRRREVPCHWIFG